ncbi:616_t:CDS:2 [Diversispora eburnea]|uniref:616_t:CDS:1 n=1 Tax=Diversispora eburnea TaxID=1213867 RepID=A0A9N9F5P8_9GLOM|nr:616_t:CDS:2 [Diversispora eburnea]
MFAENVIESNYAISGRIMGNWGMPNIYNYTRHVGNNAIWDCYNLNNTWTFIKNNYPKELDVIESTCNQEGNISTRHGSSKYNAEPILALTSYYLELSYNNDDDNFCNKEDEGEEEADRGQLSSMIKITPPIITLTPITTSLIETSSTGIISNNPFIPTSEGCISKMIEKFYLTPSEKQLIGNIGDTGDIGHIGVLRKLE